MSISISTSMLTDLSKRFMPTVAAVLLFSISMAGCVVNVPLPSQEVVEKTLSGTGQNKILLIDISGAISDSEKTGLLGISTEPRLTARIKDELMRAEEDDHIKAVLLRINSPGGLVTPSDIVHHEIVAFKERTGKPVAAHLMGVAASGGYYIALSADSISAQPTSVTGSVGVIAFMLNASGLMEKVGITNETVKSGRDKDVGSPFRPMTDADRAALRSIIDAMFEGFARVVREGRPEMSSESMEEVLEGGAFVAPRALELGLIDSVGYLDDTVDRLKSDLGLTEVRVVTYGRVSTFDDNIYSRSLRPVPSSPTSFPTTVNLVNIDASSFLESFSVSFMYMWLPN